MSDTATVGAPPLRPASDAPKGFRMPGADSNWTLRTAAVAVRRHVSGAFSAGNKDDGSVHVAVSRNWTIALVAASFMINLLLYGILMGQLQASVKDGIEKAPVIRDILNSSIGYPLLPMLGRSVEAQWTPAENAVVDFADSYTVTPEQWFEVLRRLGVIVDQKSTWDEFIGSKVTPADQPVQRLISALADASKGKALGEVTALPLLVGLATRLEGGSASSGAASGDAIPCWTSALAQVMAGFPGRWEALSAEVRRGHSNRAPQGGNCSWTQNGRYAGAPSLERYMFEFGSSVPSEADLVRVLFEGTGALLARKGKPDLPENDLAEPLDRRSFVPPPNLVEIQTRNLAEQFGRQLISATRTTADVAGPKLWLDMLVGWPQAVLNWFFLMLLFLVVARMILLGQMRHEVGVIRRWLDVHKALLREPKKTRVGKSLEVKAEELNTLHNSGGTRIGGALEPQSPDSRSAELRPRSLITLMAEKAVRRLVVGTAQPELFREFCEARRAMVDESAWALRYLSRALPALGFVGTILGILFALNGADGIVRASTQAERIAAMAAVTSPLAFAFAHTFIALVAGLVTGLLVDMETARERLLLLAYEEDLIEKIDPAEQEAA